MAIAYQLEPDLTPGEFIDILVRSTLSERRPVGRPDVIRMEPQDSCWVIPRTHSEE